MYLQNLSLKNFRIFSDIEVNFKNGINILSGPNGQGKTSILESIYFLALTRSFKSIYDKNVIKYDREYFNIKGKLIIDSKNNFDVLISYSKTEKKQLYLNRKKIDKFSTYVGKIPCVLLTLEDLKLTMGFPANRRNFMDILLSQISPIYLQNLKAYKKTVQQKNKYLTELSHKIDQNQLEAWSNQLINYGSQIIFERLKFVDFINQYINKYYKEFTKLEEKIFVKYNSNVKIDLSSYTLEKIKQNFYEKIIKAKHLEIEKKTSIVGPHRDDLDFLKNNKSFREFASQGENKTLIIVLKIIEWLYLKNKKTRKPILLLDDIFGELDRIRIKGLLKFLDGIGQSFITTTLKDIFQDVSKKHSIYLEDKNIIYG
jgi:DNA replication and repair protein RecF